MAFYLVAWPEVLPSILIAVLAVLIAYSGAPPVALVAALGLVAAWPWLQNDRRNAHAYLALLGVQIALPWSLVGSTFRVGIADFFVLPIIAHTVLAAWRGQRQPATMMRSPLLLVVLAISAALLVGVSNGGGLPAYVWFNKWTGCLFLIGGFYALSSQLRTGPDVSRAVDVFITGASVVNLAALLAALVSVTVLPNLIFNLTNERLYGWMLNPSTYGSFVATAALLEIGRIGEDGGGSRWRHAGRWFNYSLLVLSVGLTVSRSAWLAMAVAGLMTIALHMASKGGSTWGWPKVVAVVVSMLAPVLLLSWILLVQWQRIAIVARQPSAGAEMLQARMTDYCAANWDPAYCSDIRPDLLNEARRRQAQSALPPQTTAISPSPAASGAGTNPDGRILNSRGLEDRAAILTLAWQQYMATNGSRLLGIGLGTYFSTSARVLGLPLIIHNTFAWFLVEMGPLGLLAIAWCLGRTAVSLWHVQGTSGWQGDLAQSLVAALAGWVAFSTLNEAFYLRHFWLILVLADRLFVLSQPQGQRAPA